MLNRKLPLQLNQTYTLEDIHALSKMALNRMCWRFDVSGWVGNVPNLLREAIANIPHFVELYRGMNENQQRILRFVCEEAGVPVTVAMVCQEFSKVLPQDVIQTLLANLVEEGWLLEVANPPAVLAIQEFKVTLHAIPAFQQFLQAQLPTEHPATVLNGQFFSDLVEMAAFLYVEKPKLTTKGLLVKTVLRRLVARLSPAATAGWEATADEHLYTNKMNMLFRTLQATNTVEIIADSADNRHYEFDTERWDDFIFSPSTHRLLAALSLEIARIHYLKRGSLPFVASLLKTAANAGGRWQTSAYLMVNSAQQSTVVFVPKDPFRSEEWLEVVVLEPLLYLGIFEKTSEKLDTPWLKESQQIRNFWRLTPLGIALGEWLGTESNEGEAFTRISKVDIFNKKVAMEFSTLFAKWEGVLPIEIEQQLIIQPDLSFFVPRHAPPYLIWVLSVFGTMEMQEYVYQGTFSRDSILRALKGGIPVSELFEVITDHSKVPPAENVIQALEHWCASYDRTIFAKTLLLACDTDEMAMEILAQSKLALWIIGPIGSRTLLIKPEGEGMIRKWLEKKNWVPRPGMVTGDGLHKWLNKKE